MNNDAFEQWADYAKNATVPLVRFNEISARTLEEVARQQFDLAKDYMDLGTRQIKLLSEVKDPQNWAQQQNALATEFGQKLMARAEEFTALAAKTQKEMLAWADEASKQTVAAAKAAPKK